MGSKKDINILKSSPTMVEVDDRLVHIVNVPVTIATRQRYYVLSEKLNQLRDELTVGKPKKMTQLTREAIEQVLNEVEDFINLKMSERNR